MDISEGFGEPLARSDLFAAESFATRHSRRDGTSWLALGGELDVFSVPALTDALAEAEAGNPDAIVLDLRGLSFLDSSGLAAILAAYDRRRLAGLTAPQVLIAGADAVASLFETIGASEFLDVVDEEAS